MALTILSALHKTHVIKLLSSTSKVPKCFNLVQKMHRKSIYKTQEAKKIRFYVFHKYVEYMKSYEPALEKRFPRAMRVYRVFIEGTKLFLTDLKSFVKIVRFLNKKGNNFSNLSREELELYHQMPRDMLKVAPVLLLSVLPFANYVIFPVAYIFPRHLLCSHFWNLQQKSEFNVIYLKKRLHHHRPVFRHLQAQLDSLKGSKLCEPWANILGMLGSGVQPTTDQILKCKDLFSAKPYHIIYLNRNHVKHLLRMHGMYVGLFRRARLTDHASILRAMDRAIEREGGVENLSPDILKKACRIRGLNPTNMKNEDMVTWLQKWMTISNAVDKETLSLLLHTPILIGYNEPSNWILIYSSKR